MYLNIKVTTLRKCFILVCLVNLCLLSEGKTIGPIKNNGLQDVKLHNFPKFSKVRSVCQESSEERSVSEEAKRKNGLRFETGSSSNEWHSKEYLPQIESKTSNTHGKNSVIKELSNKIEGTLSSVKNRAENLTRKIGQKLHSGEKNLKGLISGIETKAEEEVKHLEKEISNGNLAHDIKGTVSKVENGVGSLIKGLITGPSKNDAHNHLTEESYPENSKICTHVSTLKNQMN